MQKDLFLKKWLMITVIFSTLIFPAFSWAGGIALGATRVIYPANAKQVSLAVTNTDDKNRFLIQSWIENAKGEKTEDFILTPPLFVSNPKSENTLRIIYGGEGLPNDRETLFWLNSKSIPSINKDEVKDKNILQIAVLARIKMFVRPEGLLVQSAEAPNMLSFQRQGTVLTITNPSPYYITLINLKLGEKSLPNTMVDPKSSVNLTLPSAAGGTVSYQTINDYGANTPVINIPVN